MRRGVHTDETGTPIVRPRPLDSVSPSSRRTNGREQDESAIDRSAWKLRAAALSLEREEEKAHRELVAAQRRSAIFAASAQKLEELRRGRKAAQLRAFDKASAVLGRQYDFIWQVRGAEWTEGLKNESQLGRVEVIGEIKAWKSGKIEWLILWDPRTDEGWLHKVRATERDLDRYTN